VIAAKEPEVPVDAIVSSVKPKPRAETDRRFTPRNPPGRRTLDIGGAITRALAAAGLIK
jgi:hypothetical protein